MKIEHGKRYIRRDGKATAALIDIGPLVRRDMYRFWDPANQLSYPENGRYLGSHDSSDDLVAEYAGSADGRFREWVLLKEPNSNRALLFEVGEAMTEVEGYESIKVREIK